MSNVNTRNVFRKIRKESLNNRKHLKNKGFVTFDAKKIIEKLFVQKIKSLADM